MATALTCLFVVGIVVMVVALRFKNPDDHGDCDCHHDHK